ncbi:MULTISPECIES: DUF2214 family protein [Chromobacterium]|uniref:DUF2214 family protein n=1 Tax=Chromobacterium rhizoryzae TaxID=1778675 RepID=A0AAD0RVE0_9NEIS|nr:MULTISPECIES: DUF2214 family protein [Chromobacterium]AXT44938.1 DUF2214 family protein [Chromobacterium rhizoryzae]OQS39079.1 hypothetical protein B0T40_04675 [Chromobacterium haemolyticum]PTU72147.1 DUF2214 domain-containing protein [Chromobacterium haemolyticum]BBH11027.1 hypothetical protein CH06BL_02750 [Chromobacterium haemolyticum]
MLWHWLLASLHLLALGAGLAALWSRAGLLRQRQFPSQTSQLFRSHRWWLLALMLWTISGLGLLSLDPSRLQHPLFILKLLTLTPLLLLEVRASRGLMRWQSQLRIQRSLELRGADSLARSSYWQIWLLLAVVGESVALHG